MDAYRLQRELVEYTMSLFREGVLDRQFTQLQELRDDDSPDFVVEVVSIFFKDAERLISNMSNALDQQQGIDLQKVDAAVHQLKGCSASVGAQRVTNTCISFRKCCEDYNLQGCFLCLHQLRYEYSLVKGKLEHLFRLEQQVLAAGGSLPVVN